MIASGRFFETDFAQTNIEGSNCKKVPSDKIITRRSASSSNSSSSKGSPTGSPKHSLSICSKESDPNSALKSSPGSKESRKSSLKTSPIAGLKRLLSKSSSNVFKPIQFGSRKSISVPSTSPTEPSSTDKIPPKTATTPAWEQISKTDSIDKTIIENNDLKKILVRSYNVDVKHIDDLLDESAVSLHRVASVPKPPRIFANVEKGTADQMEALLQKNVSPQSNSQTHIPQIPIPQLNTRNSIDLSH